MLRLTALKTGKKRKEKKASLVTRKMVLYSKLM